jgi:Arc/MetJ family transcription regulator
LCEFLRGIIFGEAEAFDTQNKIAYTLFMETAVTIDADILNKAMQVAAGQTQRQLVEDALRLFAFQNKQGEARKYRGKLQWEGNLDELRTAKW